MAKRRAASSVPEPRRRLTEAERVQLALEKYEPLKGGHSPIADDRLAAAHKIGVRAVVTAVEDAFRNGWVALVPVDYVPAYRLDAGLPELLETRIARLKSRLSGPAPGTGSAPAHKVGQKLDVIVVLSDTDVDSRGAHSQVGKALADHLKKAHGFKSHDVVATSSGRLCHFAIKNLPPFEPALEDISICSLTGTLFIELSAQLKSGRDPSSAAAELTLDADMIILELARRFGGGFRTLPMKCAVTFSTPETRNAMLAGSGLDHMMRDEQMKPGGGVGWHAIVGLGVFAPGEQHRLYEAVTEPRGSSGKLGRRDIAKVDRILQPIAPLLIELATKVDQIVEAYPVFHPVTDIANRFMVLAPPKTIRWKGTPPRPYHRTGKGANVVEKTVSKKHRDWLLTEDPIRRTRDLALLQGIEKLKDQKETLVRLRSFLEVLGDWTILDLVTAINERMVTVTKTQLNDMNVWLGCATWRKARGVAEVLRRFPHMIRVLVLDADAANELIYLFNTEEFSNPSGS